MTLSLAPIRGITDYTYRSIFPKIFTGFDNALAPFIAASNQINIEKKLLKDFEPTKVQSIKTIPQILSKENEDFLTLANALFDYGYETTNWNLGCPHPLVTSKKKGSALLAYPHLIEQFLEKTIPHLKGNLSIKLRLGYQYEDEIFSIIPILNKYPISEIIIHPRTGVQQYKGEVHLDTFEKCLPLTKIPITYNGDINTYNDFVTLKEKFPTVQKWMIGRGALRNPLLPEEIKSGKTFSKDEKLIKLRMLHDNVFDAYKDILCAKHLLDKMKGQWEYWANMFSDEHKTFKKIKKTRSPKEYIERVNEIFLME